MLGLPEVSPDQASAALNAVSGGATPGVMLGSALVVFARIAGFFLFVPFFGSLNIPMMARVGLAAVLAVVITPLVVDSVAPGVAAAGGGTGVVFLIVNQALIGLLLALVASFVFQAVESAGRIIDTQRGTNMSDVIAPQSGERTSPAGQWLMMVALVILLVSNQHLLLLDGIVKSFDALPATTSLDWITHGGKLEGSAVQELARLSGKMLELTVQIAAPAMISLMLADVLLGIINRGAPQVNVFALGMIIKPPLGVAAMLVGLAATVVFLCDHMIPHMLENDIPGMLGKMAGG